MRPGGGWSAAPPLFAPSTHPREQGHAVLVRAWAPALAAGGSAGGAEVASARARRRTSGRPRGPPPCRRRPLTDAASAGLAAGGAVAGAGARGAGATGSRSASSARGQRAEDAAELTRSAMRAGCGPRACASISRSERSRALRSPSSSSCVREARRSSSATRSCSSCSARRSAARSWAACSEASASARCRLSRRSPSSARLPLTGARARSASDSSSIGLTRSTPSSRSSASTRSCCSAYSRCLTLRSSCSRSTAEAFSLVEQLAHTPRLLIGIPQPLLQAEDVAFERLHGRFRSLRPARQRGLAAFGGPPRPPFGEQIAFAAGSARTLAGSIPGATGGLGPSPPESPP